MARPADSNDYDIVIAGGGMIGSSLAAALAPLGLRVAIVEPVSRSAASQPSFDDRATALSRSSQRMYEAMGLWDDIVQAATPIHHIHISDKGRFGFSHIDAAEQGVEALGYVIINRVLGDVLRRTVGKVESLEQLCPARIVAAEPRAEDVTVHIEAGDRSQALGCRLLVAADGARSPTRERVGITVRYVDYGQCAIVGNLLTEMPLENRAFERFTEHGPLALLPLDAERAGFVWTVAAADAERVLGLDDDEFCAALQAAFGYRLGQFSRVGKRTSYPLTLSKALRLTTTRTVLAGNAAHGLHPVAAQGFNLGLRDVAALCDCIADAANEGADIGAAALLERYSDWRRGDQKKLVGLTDGLVRLFGDPSGPVRVLRDIGMIGFDLVPGVRSLFAKHTMGLAGRLPRLSRGVPLS